MPACFETFENNFWTKRKIPKILDGDAIFKNSDYHFLLRFFQGPVKSQQPVDRKHDIKMSLSEAVLQ